MAGKRNKEREGGGTHASERTALKLRDSCSAQSLCMWMRKSIPIFIFINLC